MGWTESQQNAIDARGRNILVSAPEKPPCWLQGLSS